MAVLPLYRTDILNPDAFAEQFWSNVTMTGFASKGPSASKVGGLPQK